MIYVVATLKIRAETREKFLAGARAVIAGTVKETGCVSYELHQSILDPERYVFVERWEERSNLDAHFHAPHFKVWRAVGADCIIDRKIEIIHADKIEKL